jgi:hypothetical protein
MKYRISFVPSLLLFMLRKNQKICKGEFYLSNYNFLLMGVVTMA